MQDEMGVTCSRHWEMTSLKGNLDTVGRIILKIFKK
jgi:hypothetical protein